MLELLSPLSLYCEVTYDRVATPESDSKTALVNDAFCTPFTVPTLLRNVEPSMGCHSRRGEKSLKTFVSALNA